MQDKSQGSDRWAESSASLHDMCYAIHFHSHYSTFATFFTPYPSHLIRVILFLLIRGTLQTILHGNPRLILLHAQGYVPSPSLEWWLCCQSALTVTFLQAWRMPFHCHLPSGVAALGSRVFSAALQVWVSLVLWGTIWYIRMRNFLVAVTGINRGCWSECECIVTSGDFPALVS